MIPPIVIEVVYLATNYSMNYGGMDFPDAQLFLQKPLSNSYVNENGYPNPQMLHADFFDGLENMSTGLDNIFDDCFPREFLIPQMTARPSASFTVDGPKSDTQISTQQTSHDISSCGAGDGPLPADFGMPSVNNRNGNAPLDFTKRRNWSQHIIEEIRDFLHVLTPDGRMIYLSPSAEPLTGYTKGELKGQFIVDFIHPDDKAMFLREFNESIASGNNLRYFYRFLKKNQSYIILESHGHPHFRSDMIQNGNTGFSNSCEGYFMMARPYLTKNSSLLDSFLEHKVENQRLLKRIEQLRKEEEIEEEAQQNWLKQADQLQTTLGSPVGSNYTSNSQIVLGHSGNTYDAISMPPPARPVGAPLTKKALEESIAGLKQDSMKDKMERYKGVSQIESIEMLTGLRYREGERSYGISTGAQSPLLIRGDAGISLPLESEVRSDKKRKLKLADEYVCTDCGTLDSPEWRKGPSGPKTLCNACGLRWAKKEKKKPTFAIADRTVETKNAERIMQ
ncbi:Cutinase gene palindrome-binding protein [Erysiphe neolycopersici]|uniref:Cutinase gene palindrome-binding protein n=1 Tax=Erysiphe neolycopersici TaxID=212602 RepID=A0A420HI19_9PEZI|nr:Cutinase gene palindrome-binding protein [Erysiphe neolycopersici]